MRVVHFTLGSVDPDSLNGINRVIEGLASTMNSAGLAEVSVITVRRKMKHNGRQVFQRDGFDVTACHSTAEALKLFAEIEGRVDLVHLHNAWSRPNVRIGAWLSKRNIPYVITVHGALLPDRNRRTLLKGVFHRFAQRELFERAAGLIAVSRDEMSNIAEYTSNPRIELVLNSIRDINWREHRTPRSAGDTVSVGYLGRISREKNIQALIQAVHLLPAEIQARLRIHVFGDPNTDYGRRCQRLALSLSVSEVVQFHGKVSATEKWRALGMLDAYIQPSLSDVTPNSVLEAIAMRLPVVVTRTSGVSYWHGQSFLTMVEPVASDLARGLEVLVRNGAKLPELGAQAMAFYEENFTWAVAVQRQLEVYQHSLAGSQTDSPV